MKASYLTLIRIIGLVENFLCYAGLLLATVMVVAQVINRYILHIEVMWIGDLSLYVYIPMMILSIAFTAREGGHTTVDVFVDVAFVNSPFGKKVHAIAIDLVGLAIMLYMLPMAARMFMAAFHRPEYGTLVRWFNTSWIREMVLVMVVLCIIHSLHRIGVKVLALRAGAAAEGGVR